MDVLTQFWSQAKKTWGGLTPSQRVAGLALVGLIVAALATAGLWGGQADFVPLFSKPMENQQEVGSVLGILKNADIPVRQENGQILVPASARDRAFVELSGKNAWPQDQSLDELKSLEKDWTMSDQSRKDRTRLTLQTRLGRMIGLMEGVQSANVILAEGNSSVFSADHFDAKATVQVVLRPGAEALSDGVAETIRRVVAFGVQGVKPAAVAVVDSLGRIYEDRGSDFQAAPDTFDKLRHKREEEITGKVRRALADAHIRGSFTYSMELNQDREKVVSHKVNPDETAVTDEKNETRTQNGGSSDVGGVPGAASNMGNAEPLAGTGTSTSLNEEKNEIHRDVSHEDREIIKGVGDVKKAMGGFLYPYPKGTPEPDVKTLDACRDFIMKAAGITDPAFVTVSALAYDPAPAVQASRWDDTLSMLLAHADQLGVFLLAAGALVVLGMVLRRSTARAGAYEDGEEGVAGAVSAIRRARAEPLPEMTPEGTRFAEMETRVRDMVRKDPRMSAGLVKRWLMTSPAPK